MMANVTTRHCWTALLVLVVLLLLAPLVEACPGCKDALENDPQGEQIARGYFWSILFMMSMPFVILGTIGTYFYIEIRRARADKQQLQQHDTQETFLTTKTR